MMLLEKYRATTMTRVHRRQVPAQRSRAVGRSSGTQHSGQSLMALGNFSLGVPMRVGVCAFAFVLEVGFVRCRLRATPTMQDVEEIAKATETAGASLRSAVAMGLGCTNCVGARPLVREGSRRDAQFQ